LASKSLHYTTAGERRKSNAHRSSLPVPAHRSELSPSQLAPAKSFLPQAPESPLRAAVSSCSVSARHANAIPKSCHFARKSSREARTFSNRGSRVAAAGMRLRRVVNRCCPDFQIETRTRARTPSAGCRSALPVSALAITQGARLPVAKRATKRQGTARDWVVDG